MGVPPPSLFKLDFYLTPHVFWRYHIYLDVYVVPLKYEKLWKDKEKKLKTTILCSIGSFVKKYEYMNLKIIFMKLI